MLRYVFHEVRVPLNTARKCPGYSNESHLILSTTVLAVQNMEASGTVAKTQEVEFKALEGSLSMMSKVLNDVLDLFVPFPTSLVRFNKANNSV